MPKYLNRLAQSGNKSNKSPIWRQLLILIPIALISLEVLLLSTDDSNLLIRLYAYLFPWFWLILASTCLLAFKYRQYLVIGLSGLMIVYISLLNLHLFIPSRTMSIAPLSTEQSPQIKILSYNVLGRNKQPLPVGEVILNAQADIVFLQEANTEVSRYLSRLFVTISEPLYPYHLGNILSQYPLSLYESGDQIFDRVFKPVLIDSPLGPIIGFSIHLPRSLDHLADHQFAISEISQFLQNKTEHIIYAGDFNTTPHNTSYTQLSKILNNAHDKAGSGLGFTFPSRARRIGWLSPFARIDHIFTSKRLNTLSAGTIDTSGSSDHFPVYATLSNAEALTPEASH